MERQNTFGKLVSIKAASLIRFAAFFVCVAGSFGFCHSSAARWLDDVPQSFFVDIDSSSDLVKIKFLSKYDVAGTNSEKKTIQLLVTKQQVDELRKNGFVVKSIVAFASRGLAPHGYTRPEEVYPKLKAIADKYPDVVTIFSAGKSVQERDIYGVVIGTKNGRTDKPYVMFNAMHHAREVMTTEVVLHAIDQLAEGYGSDAEVTSWLDNLNIVAVPQVNPDGNNIVHSDYGGWRKNAFKRGRVVGVDLNRNYPTMWGGCGGSSGDVSDQTYRGPNAGSEPETKALMALFETYKPVANISYHSYGELILYPFGCDNVTNPASDTFFKIAVAMSKELVNDNGIAARYTVGIGPDVLYVTDGTDNDWQWAEHGVLSYTIEVNAEDQNFQPDYTKWRDVTVKRQEGGWKQLLRRVMQSSLKATVTSNQYDISKLTYTVTALTPNGNQKWNNAIVKPFALKNANGLLYQILGTGKYQIDFYANGNIIGSKNVDMAGSLVDLGELRF